MHYLFDSCSEDQQRSLLTCLTARDIWVSLTSRYQQNSTERKQSLGQEFLTYKFNPEHNIRSHVEAIKLIGQQLREAGGAMDDEGICGRILTTLPPSLHYFRCAYESTPITERTLENLTTRLVREEERLNEMNKGQRSPADKAFYGERPPYEPNGSQHGPADKALYGERPPQLASRNQSHSSFTNGNSKPTPYSRNNRGQSGGRNLRGNRLRGFGRCNYCNIYGHEEKDCQHKLSGAVPCPYCKIYGHTEEECYRKQRNNSSAQLAQTYNGYAAGRSSTPRSRSEFLLDSGASSHMTDQLWMIENFTPMEPGAKWIKGIGQARSAILGTGNINVITSVNGTSCRRTIHNVLYAPSLGVNLFSVGAATAGGAEIHFTDSKAVVTRNGVIEMTASRIGDQLYCLDIDIPKENESYIARPFQNSIHEWHCRLGHIGYQTIIKMATTNAVIGLDLPAGTKPPLDRCHACALGKMKRCTFQLSTSHSQRIGSLIHSDVCGPMQVASLGGARYYVSFHDDFSGFRAVYFLTRKSEVPDCCKAFFATLHTQTGNLVTALRTDGGTEYKPLEPWMKMKGIRHETTTRYTPQQNGVSERDNRTIVEGARTLLYSNKAIPLTLWAEAVNCFVYTLNRTLSKTCPTITPFEAWYHRKPDVSNLRIFGSEFYVLVPQELRRKLDAKGLLCIFVGNSETQKGDRYWDPTTGKINISRDVTPCNHSYQPSLPTTDVQKGIDVFKSDDVMISQPVTQLPTTNNPVDPPPAEEPRQPNASPNRATDANVELTPTPFHGFGPEELLAPHPSASHSTLPAATPRRSVRLSRQKAFMCMSASTSLGEVEPNHFQDAMVSEQASNWKTAINSEYASLMKNRTWDLVHLPPNRSLIKSRWTFRIKPGYQTTAKIYKARFVAKGFSQVPGTDYTAAEIYAPVVKYDSLRVLLSLAAALDLELWQLDVKTAFLYGDLDEELFLQQPEGFVLPGQEQLVCHLLKPIYGLKQAPRKWNEKFSSFLKLFGLTQSSADPCIYFRTGDDLNDFVMIGIWVDDGLIACKSASTALAIVDYLKQHFEMTSGPANRFIGLEITRDRLKKQLYVTQSGYIQQLIDKFRMANCNPSDIPADPCSRLSLSNCPPGTTDATLNTTSYRALVGGLLYVMGLTRPEISFAVIAVSRFCQNPGQAHWKAAKLILAYLVGTLRYGLCFSNENPTNALVGYCDSDFAGCPDTRRSTTGVLFLLNGAPVSWKSKLQKPIAQSTAEAEYYAAGHAGRDNAWLRDILQQLGLGQPAPTPIHCDNNSAIRLVYNPEFHDRTKHIELKYHFIRSQAQIKNLEMVPVASLDQLADILTKPLAGPAFKLNRSRIGVAELPETLMP